MSTFTGFTITNQIDWDAQDSSVFKNPAEPDFNEILILAVLF